MTLSEFQELPTGEWQAAADSASWRELRELVEELRSLYGPEDELDEYASAGDETEALEKAGAFGCLPSDNQEPAADQQTLF